MQLKVTQEDCTEPAFDNAYWDNKQEGIYVEGYGHYLDQFEECSDSSSPQN